MDAKEYIRSRTTFKHLGIFDRANIAIHMEKYHEHKVETAWINVKDELPPDDSEVLIQSNKLIEPWIYVLNYNSKRYNQKGFWLNENDEYHTDYTAIVAYWQCKPNPIK